MHRVLEGMLPGLEPEECPGWSKPVTNRYQVLERRCKCGRAKIVKIDRPGMMPLFVPELDGEALPIYFSLAEAKEAIEVAATGEMPPAARRPSRRRLEYENVGQAQGQASYERTKTWFRERTGQAQVLEDRMVQALEEAFETLGLSTAASLGEVRKRVRVLQHEYHPDRCTDPEAGKKFAAVMDAWATIQEEEGGV